MIGVNEYLDYIEQINVSPRNALIMAQMSYRHSVLSLPNYLEIRSILESKLSKIKAKR